MKDCMVCIGGLLLKSLGVQQNPPAPFPSSYLPAKGAVLLSKACAVCVDNCGSLYTIAIEALCPNAAIQFATLSMNSLHIEGLLCRPLDV